MVRSPGEKTRSVRMKRPAGREVLGVVEDRRRVGVLDRQDERETSGWCGAPSTCPLLAAGPFRGPDGHASSPPDRRRIMDQAGQEDEFRARRRAGRAAVLDAGRPIRPDRPSPSLHPRPALRGPPEGSMQTKFLLGENQIPTHWYNVIADLPAPPAPVLHPGTLKPVTPADMLPLFPPGLLEQEMSAERWIKIPDEVREIYKLWRPSPAHPRPPAGDSSSARRPRSTSSTRGSRRPAPTSRTPRCRRPTTTSWPARSASPPRPAPGSGAPPSPWPARCSAWSAPSTW